MHQIRLSRTPKEINRITKKLDKHNKKWIFEILPDTVEKVTVIDYSNPYNVPLNQFQPKYSSIVLDIANYNFEMEPLKLGEYEVIAVLEHNAIEGSNENLVHVIKEGATIPLEYRTIKSYCQHCNSDRKRNKTVLLQDQNNSIIQVGSTCIKEYTGIDGLDIIGNYQDVKNIVIEDLSIDYDNVGNYGNSKYINTLDYLISCIQLISEKGYKKEETKWQAWTITGTDKQDNKYQPIAQTILDYFKSKTFGECQDFLNNIKLTLSQEYCKISGFVAYAYLAYQKQLEYEAKKQAEAEHKKQSDYVGEIGKKIETELILKNRIAYGANYNGYCETTNYIYLFEDSAGNTFKWNTSKFLEKIVDNCYEVIQPGEKIKIKGSIKAHEEYKDQKQTVITRCKLIN